jgi:hypothetical protein
MCGQSSDYVIDNLPIYEQAEVADAIDSDGLHAYVAGHRPRARDDDVL